MARMTPREMMAYRLPVLKMADFYSDMPTEMGYDEVRYNANTMSYETKSQKMALDEKEKEIKILQEQLSAKKEKEKQDMKSLVAYYYNRK